MISVKFRYLSLLSLFLLMACNGHEKNEQSIPQPKQQVGNALFDLGDIQQNGEIIVLMLYGPENYFEFRGENFGTQYMLANEYAKSIGCRIRVEVSRNPKEMVEKLLRGEGDIIASHIEVVDSLKNALAYCGQAEICHFLDSLSVQRRDPGLKTDGHSAWAVRGDASVLQESLNQWIATNESSFFDMTTIRVKGSGGKTYTPHRNVKSPILNVERGEISTFDTYFKQYARQCGWDWRLIAAQAYQESGFDPNAVSWAGAMGLMQLMPSTARSVGVGQNEVFDPECNVRGAAKLITQLNSHYSGIVDGNERINFILAAYNAGPGHVDDARALARKYGKDPDKWLGNVDSYVLNMSQSEYYNQPEVKHGYFRGSETYNYVNKIRTRWDEYKSKVK